MLYEKLQHEYLHLTFIEDPKMPEGLDGLCINEKIYINKCLNAYEKHGVLAEEIGHSETTYGDIIDLDRIINQKLENIARRWGYQKIVPLSKIIECHELGINTIEEVCVHLEVTESYFKKSIDYYFDKYGIYKKHGNYNIFFDPLYILPI
ncbi:ImmA/IrrE family metallo-endopeptidase [Psychrobacillus sp. FSL K6-1267]|uniref:ImmA/IrrE family metallo-endopeptidase n=1 Tax=Psychrobacillus sp. FSL K6-1267 TaxID=2921543 RepID=UPI0030FC0B50